MSVAILGDCHVGAHGSNPTHHAYMAKFFVDFFKYIDDNKITTIIQLGDLFDVRKHVTTWSLNWFKQHVLKPIIERNLMCYVLVGNHDIHYRESVTLSSVREVLDPYSDWFTVVDTPKDYYIDDKWFLLVPWVCRENMMDINSAIQSSVAEYCCGHFEFDGFELYRGQLAKSHYTHASYSKFTTVFSGHYHHMSRRDNIQYTGTPYELTWQDADTTKGFFVLSDSLELVENPHKIYSKVELSKVDVKNLAPHVTEKHVRVIIDEALDQKQRDRLEDTVYSLSPLSVKFVEQVVEKQTASTTSYNGAIPITNLITDYVNNVTLPDSVDVGDMNTLMIKLHVEASTSAS